VIRRVETLEVLLAYRKGTVESDSSAQALRLGREPLRRDEIRQPVSAQIEWDCQKRLERAILWILLSVNSTAGPEILRIGGNGIPIPLGERLDCPVIHLAIRRIEMPTPSA
jgi:hypothetical protein